MSSSPAIFWRRFCLGGPDTSQSTEISDSSAAPHQDGTKQGRRCSHATRSLDKLWAAFPWVETVAWKILSWVILDTWPIVGISRFGEVAWHPGLYRFQTCALFYEVSHRELFANIPSLPFIFWQYSFSRHLRFMTTGDDRNEDRLKTESLRSLKVTV